MSIDSTNNTTNSLFEDPSEFVPQILEHLNPLEDVEAQREIESNLRRAEHLRTQIRDRAEKALTELERKVELLSDIYQNKLVERESLTALHSSKMMESTKMKFLLSSEVEEMRSNKKSLIKELESLEQELKLVDAEQDSEEQLPPDEVALKLQIARAMGIELLQNQENGKYDKARVVCSKKNDIAIIEFDDQFSSYYHSNVLWEMCS